MKKRLLSLLLVLAMLLTSMTVVFADGNPAGSVPNGEDKNGFFPGVWTEYYDVEDYQTLGTSFGLNWENLVLGSGGNVDLIKKLKTAGVHTAGGADYVEATKGINAFFLPIKSGTGEMSKDSFRNSGYVFLKAGTTLMRITSDDGVIFRIDETNSDVTVQTGMTAKTPAGSWSLHGAQSYDFTVTVASDGYYRYEVDYFNWGGDGVLKWETQYLGIPSVESEASLTNVSGLSLIPEANLFLYEAPKYKLTLLTGGNGSLTSSPAPSDMMFDAGTEVTLLPAPTAGYQFDSYTGDAVTGNKIVMNGNKTVTAHFTTIPTEQPTDEPTESPLPSPSPTTTPNPVPNVSLTVTVEGPGTAWPAGTGRFSQDSIVVMSVTPGEGATFIGWFGANGAEVSDNRILMNGSKSVTARFEIPTPVEPSPVPEAAPVITADEVDMIAPEVVPEAAPVVEELEEVVEVPQAAPELPKTGGLPMLLLFGAGAVLTAGGLKVRRK